MKCEAYFTGAQFLNYLDFKSAIRNPKSEIVFRLLYLIIFVIFQLYGIE